VITFGAVASLPTGPNVGTRPQNVSRPLQVSPVLALRADATTWSAPPRLAMTRSTSKDPLGALVVREPVKTRTPLSEIATLHT
jgi:hypothetical protein